jgi:hypothetical protein
LLYFTLLYFTLLYFTLLYFTLLSLQDVDSFDIPKEEDSKGKQVILILRFLWHMPNVYLQLWGLRHVMRMMTGVYQNTRASRHNAAKV